MLLTFLAVLPIFLLIVSGYWLRRSLLPDAVFWRGVERLTYYVLFPALLLLATSRADLGNTQAMWAIVSVILASIVVGILALLAKGILDINNATVTSIFQGSIRYNTFVFLGLSLGLFGTEQLSLIALFIASMVIFLNFSSVAVLHYYCAHQTLTVIQIIKMLLCNPLVISPILGLSLAVMQWPITDSIHSFLNTLGSAATPMSLLAVGASLVLRINRHQVQVVVYASCLKLLVLPLITFGFLFVFEVTGVMAQIAMVYACVPTAGNAFILAKQMGGDEKAVASIITWTTAAAFISMPVILYSFGI